MEHHEPPIPPPTTPLPPGCRFHPIDHQLLTYYLLNKNSNHDNNHQHHHPRPEASYSLDFDIIRELDVYSYDPFNLPESNCYIYGFKGRRRHWYCYCVRAKRERFVRRTESGFWKRRGRVRDVVGGGGVVVGRKVSFVFHLGDLGEGAVRTDWCMDEFSLVDLQAYVLCRVFMKFHDGHASNASEHALCSFAPKNVSAVRHIGVQRNETVTSDIDGAKACLNNSVDRGIQTSRISSDRDDIKGPGPVSDSHFQYYSGSHLLNYPELDDIQDGDFIEVDDLLSPLPENPDS